MRVDAGDISVPGFHFHPSVVPRKATLPTLTTPAPTAAGRSAPQGSMKSRSALACQRWRSDNQ
eukprot:7104803-Heterocapsa_arctica.AAC.1